jgi:hypothetical protein
MPPYSFKFTSSTADMYTIRQTLANLHWGILHYIEIQHPTVIVHYANFTNEKIRAEIELHGKLIDAWLFLPIS